jgi:SAM-dependent methyltransferase
VSLVKTGLRKLMAWYLRYVAQQVTVVGGTLTRALRLVDARVRHLEEGSVGAGPVRAELDRTDAAPRVAQLEEAATEALAGATGRVLVASCGRAELVATLVAGGVDAYGVESRRALLVDALRQGLDVRPDDAVDHLRALPEGVLGGVVLTDVVEWLPPAALVGLVLHAARALAPGGRLVVLSATPEAWRAERDRVTVDLAPGRPWHAETWAALLRNRGFVDVVVTEAPVAGGLARLPGDDAVAKAFNANVDALEPLVAAAPGYAVAARRRP